jgi:hypothetical protein
MPWNYQLRDQVTGQDRKLRAAALAIRCRPQLQPNKQISAAQWKMALRSSFDVGLREYLRSEQNLVEDHAKAFTDKLQVHLINHVAHTVALHGLRPTEIMLRKLAADLASIATTEMVGEQATMRRRVSGLETRLDNVLGDAPNLSENSPQVQEAIQTLEMAAQRFAEADLLDTAPRLMLDISRHLLEPIADGLKFAYDSLLNDFNGSNENSGGSILRRFPDLTMTAGEVTCPIATSLVKLKDF